MTFKYLYCGIKLVSEEDMKRFKIAIIDDYQKVAMTYGDWSYIQDHTDITVFSEYIGGEDRLIELLAPFDIICIMRERTLITESLVANLPNLQLIISTGPGNAAINLEAVKARGIEIANTGYVDSGAPELAWTLLMSIARHIPQENAALKNGKWQTTVGADLKGKTIGIIGLGNIGSRIAIIAKAFEMEVISWSPGLSTEEAALKGVRAVNKEELFSTADFVSIHMVLSESSKGIIKLKDMELMKPGAFLINTSRGPLINEADLIKILSERKIAGAALDVFDQEPLPADHPFRTLENVLATPHIGYVTNNTYQVFFEDTRNAILNWLLNRIPS